MKLRPAYRVVTFLPVGRKFITPADFLEGINEAVPLTYGNYDMVAYMGQGQGTYRPLPGAKPAHGKIGKVSTLETLRVEFSIPKSAIALAACLKKLRALHPWEEPGIQVYLVQDVLASAKK